MLSSGLVDRIRNDKGNEGNNYFFLQMIQNMMKEIALLRDKYNLSMRVEKYTEYNNN